MAKSMTQAVTQGLRMLGGTNVPTYTLQFISPTRNHEAGAYETIVVPYIELGRDGSSVIQYREDDTTVSRRHAAIERSGDDILIKQLSDTNPTLINGQPIKKEWYLKNGDEIQLSMEGPKLRFNTTPTKTSSLRFTQRMQLFAGQALKPYKYAVSALALLLVVAAGAGGYVIFKQGETLELYQLEALQRAQALQDQQVAFGGFLDSLNQAHRAEMEAVRADRSRLQRTIDRANARIKGLENRPPPKPLPAPPPINAAANIPQDNIFFFQVAEIRAKNLNGAPVTIPAGWTCTGWLTEDNRFITARHCIQGWRFIKLNGTDSPDMVLLNMIENNGGEITDVVFEALSPSGKKLQFNYSNARYDDSEDQSAVVPVDSLLYTLRTHTEWAKDWAYIPMGEKGNIRYDKPRSASLKAGEKAHVLGYSFGLAMQGGGLQPIYSASDIAVNGLSNNLIYLTQRSFESGNSGGPVFVQDPGGGFVAVGIVSAGRENIGTIVPVVNIK